MPGRRQEAIYEARSEQYLVIWMSWLLSQPRSLSPWISPANLGQYAEYYLGQGQAIPTYGYSQLPPQYYRQRQWPFLSDRELAESYQQPYYQPPVQQFYQQAMPQYCRPYIQPYCQPCNPMIPMTMGFYPSYPMPYTRILSPLIESEML